MKKIKVEKCRYPKCNKEIYKSNALFCLEHSRKLKEKGKKAGYITGTGIAIITSAVKFIKKF